MADIIDMIDHAIWGAEVSDDAMTVRWNRPGENSITQPATGRRSRPTRHEQYQESLALRAGDQWIIYDDAGAPYEFGGPIAVPEGFAEYQHRLSGVDAAPCPPEWVHRAVPPPAAEVVFVQCVRDTLRHHVRVVAELVRCLWEGLRRALPRVLRALGYYDRWVRRALAYRRERMASAHRGYRARRRMHRFRR